MSLRLATCETCGQVLVPVGNVVPAVSLYGALPES